MVLEKTVNYVKVGDSISGEFPKSKSTKYQQGDGYVLLCNSTWEAHQGNSNQSQRGLRFLIVSAIDLANTEPHLVCTSWAVYTRCWSFLESSLQKSRRNNLDPRRTFYKILSFINFAQEFLDLLKIPTRSKIHLNLTNEFTHILNASNSLISLKILTYGQRKTCQSSQKICYFPLHICKFIAIKSKIKIQKFKFQNFLRPER